MYLVARRRQCVEQVLDGLMLGVLGLDFQVGRLSDPELGRLGMPDIDILVIYLDRLLDGRRLRFFLLLAHGLRLLLGWRVALFRLGSGLVLSGR